MHGLFDGLLGLLGTLLYPLFSFVFMLIDLLQSVFRSFAGTGEVYYGDRPGGGNEHITGSGPTGDANKQGIVYYLMQQPIIKNIFWSMLYLAIILLVVFTVMAFLKNLYAPQPKKWQDILGSAIKGIGNFIFIPVCCLLGVWLANIGLQAVDGATSSGNQTTSISRQLFVCCAYNANCIRRKGEAWESHGLYAVINTYKYGWYSKLGIAEGQIRLGSNGGVTRDTLNDLIRLREAAGLTNSEIRIDVNAIPEGEEITDDGTYAQILDDIFSYGGTSTGLSIYDWGTVGTSYSLIYINYIILIAGGVFIMYVLGAITFAMIKRLFYLLMLYVISPIACCMYPLNDGSTVQTWRQEFLKNTISAYGAVAGMNLFFSLLPIVQNIQIPALWTFGWLGIVPLILTIAGLYVVKDFISFISSLIGADNAYSSGAGLMGSVKGRMKNGIKHANNFTKSAVSVFARAKAANDAAGPGNHGKAGADVFFTSLGKGLLSGVNKVAGLGDNALDIDGWVKSAKEGYKQKDNFKKAREFEDTMLRAAKYDSSTGLYTTVDGKVHEKGSKIGKRIESLQTSKGVATNEDIYDAWLEAGGTTSASNPTFKKFLKEIKRTEEEFKEDQVANKEVQARAKRAERAEEKRNKSITDLVPDSDGWYGLSSIGFAAALSKLGGFGFGDTSHETFKQSLRDGKIKITAADLDVDTLMSKHGISREEAVGLADYYKGIKNINAENLEVKEKGQEVMDQAEDMHKKGNVYMDETTLNGLKNAFHEATKEEGDRTSDGMKKIAQAIEGVKTTMTEKMATQIKKDNKEIVKGLNEVAKAEKKDN